MRSLERHRVREPNVGSPHQLTNSRVNEIVA
jgi:hypothetical protein